MFGTDIHQIALKGKQDTDKKKAKEKNVIGATPLPQNWLSFLRMDENKTELYGFLAEKLASVVVKGKTIVTTYGESLLTSPVEKAHPSLYHTHHLTKKVIQESFCMSQTMRNRDKVM